MSKKVGALFQGLPAAGKLLKVLSTGDCLVTKNTVKEFLEVSFV